MAYLIFAFQGISSPLISVMLLEIAKKFGVDASAIGFSFTLWIIGGGLAGLFSGKLLEMKGTRFAMLLSLVFILLSVAGTLSPILITFSIGMFISGMGTFLLVAIANCLIVQQFDGETRTSQFNLLNFFYSSGALITPAIAGVLLNQGIRWELVFLLPFILLLPMVFLALSPSFQKQHSLSTAEELSSTPVKSSSFAVYLFSTAIGFYCITELSFVSWIVVYLRESLAIDIIPASLVLTTFFICQAAGRLSSGFIVKYIALDKFIFSCCLVAFVAMLAILAVSRYNLILLMTGILALGLASIYPSILSYGTLQLKSSSPQIVTYIMNGGTIGAIIGMSFTSFLKQSFGVYSCLLTSTVSILLVIFFLAIVKMRINRSPQNDANPLIEVK